MLQLLTAASWWRVLPGTSWCHVRHICSHGTGGWKNTAVLANSRLLAALSGADKQTAPVWKRKLLPRSVTRESVLPSSLPSLTHLPICRSAAAPPHPKPPRPRTLPPLPNQPVLFQWQTVSDDGWSSSWIAAARSHSDHYPHTWRLESYWTLPSDGISAFAHLKAEIPICIS